MQRFTVVREPSWCRPNAEYHMALALYSQLREQVNNVCMIVSPLWRGPGNIHGFVLDGLLLKHQLSLPV